MKVVIFNGPKSCGKGIAVAMLEEVFKSKNYPCKEKLMSLTQELFMIPASRYWEIYNDRTLKETPVPEFRLTFTEECQNTFEKILGYELCDWMPESAAKRDVGIDDNSYNLSIREAVIYVSEVVVKPNFGSDWFGKARAAALLQSTEPLITDDSCGFAEELEPLLEVVDQKDTMLLRIHRDGLSFEGDSRRYIPNGIIDNTIDVNNNRTEEEYLDTILAIVADFINEENA